MAASPMELLKESVGKSVWLITKDPREYSGVLKGFDEYVNVVLADAVEHNVATGDSHALDGDVLLNGNSIELIVPRSRPQ